MICNLHSSLSFTLEISGLPSALHHALALEFHALNDAGADGVPQTRKIRKRRYVWAKWTRKRIGRKLEWGFRAGDDAKPRERAAGAAFKFSALKQAEIVL